MREVLALVEWGTFYFIITIQRASGERGETLELAALMASVEDEWAISPAMKRVESKKSEHTAQCYKLSAKNGCRPWPPYY